MVVGASALLLLGAALQPLGAQGVPPGSDPWRAPRVLKWTLLAVSAGLGLWAYTETLRADDTYEDLRRYCRSAEGLAACTVERGRYANARAEALFERANQGDRRARVGLLAGQAALLGSAAFFIVDLRHGAPPDDIPYHPPASPGARLRLGLRVSLP
jgi:hypothetical protein